MRASQESGATEKRKMCEPFSTKNSSETLKDSMFFSLMDSVYYTYGIIKYFDEVHVCVFVNKMWLYKSSTTTTSCVHNIGSRPVKNIIVGGAKMAIRKKQTKKPPLCGAVISNDIKRD